MKIENRFRSSEHTLSFGGLGILVFSVSIMVALSTQDLDTAMEERPYNVLMVMIPVFTGIIIGAGFGLGLIFSTFEQMMTMLWDRRKAKAADSVPDNNG